MELWLLNLLILSDWFLCNSYHCVLFESLSHVINQKSYVCLFVKFGENLPRSFFEIFKFHHFKKVNSVSLPQISLLWDY